MTATPSILLDMDGVVADFERHVVSRWYEESYDLLTLSGPIPVTARKALNVEDDYPQNHRESVRKIISAQHFFLDLPVIAGALEGVREMVHEGFDVSFCTAPLTANMWCASEKLSWVARHFPDLYRKVIITKDKTRVIGNVLVDDRPSITGAVAPVWKHVLFEAPYNRGIVDRPRMTWANWREIILPLIR